MKAPEGNDVANVRVDSSVIGRADYNRWLAMPPVLAITGSIGSLYAWSIFNGPLTRDIGVVAASSADWGLGEVVPIFSTTAVVFGCSVWGLGQYIERSGPRQCGAISAACWGGGLALAGLGAQMHSLPLVYAGYGVLGGLGFAFGYISPLSNMMTWYAAAPLSLVLIVVRAAPGSLIRRVWRPALVCTGLQSHRYSDDHNSCWGTGVGAFGGGAVLLL